ncbi:MAG: hypothetical protein LBL94_05595 [Prevotellaceae bacterium]|jgi:hypothetical protein|nr:hypothetical protein [Prevotellaceae bacterium]
MNEPVINKFPTEVFGCPYTGQPEKLQAAIQQQYCKFIKATCIKPRKSEPHIKVGICSLGYKGGFVDTHLPVIICPQRFKEDVMFETIREKYLSHWKNIEWISEVNIGVGGSVDYVAITKNRKGKIVDFLCIEIQAGGTTGSPYPAVVDLKHNGKYTKDAYNYGINWANEFSKTMMQQAYKKGKIINQWKRKVVFVVQDVAIDYLKAAADTSRLYSSKRNLPIDFCTFSLKWNKNQWHLAFADIFSTDIEGINLMLGGAEVDAYPTEAEFILNIIKKGIQDGVLNKEDYVKFL